MYQHLTGLITAPHTPMKANGDINISAIARQAELFKANAVTAAYICGSTGEGMSLTVDERIRVMEEWRQVSDASLKVIANVGHTCLKDCRRLAEQAQRLNVHAISAMAPCYYKPETVEDLVDFYADIAAAAPDTPFYAYHTPALTGVEFPMAEFLKAASGRIDTLVGVKYNHTNLMDYLECLNFDDGRYDLLFGVDEMLLSALSLGAKGAIGSTYNYAAPLYYDIIKHFNDGNIKSARCGQVQAIEMIKVLCKYSVLPAGKAIMKFIGVDCGPARKPVRSLTVEQVGQLHDDLSEIGFFRYCCCSPFNLTEAVLPSLHGAVSQKLS